MNNLEDIAKMAIEEVSSEFAQKSQSAFAKPIKSAKTTKFDNLSELKKAKKFAKFNEFSSQSEFEDLSEKLSQNEILNEDTKNSSADLIGEHIFLSNLKERIEVLFAGLNTTDDNLALRLDLTIRFLEFLLARIQERLNNLQK